MSWKAAWTAFTLKAYLVHGSEHLSRVGDSLHGAGEDVQGQFQPLQDSAAFTVHAEALQGLKTHKHRHEHTRVSARVVIDRRPRVALKLRHL